MGVAPASAQKCQRWSGGHGGLEALTVGAKDPCTPRGMITRELPRLHLEEPSTEPQPPPAPVVGRDG